MLQLNYISSQYYRVNYEIYCVQQKDDDTMNRKLTVRLILTASQVKIYNFHALNCIKFQNHSNCCEFVNSQDLKLTTQKQTVLVLRHSNCCDYI